MGFAAAITEHLALRVAWIPALAIVTVCYSMTSCIATRSTSFILSNSSMQTMPLSPSTIAPASKFLAPKKINKWIKSINLCLGHKQLPLLNQHLSSLVQLC